MTILDLMNQWNLELKDELLSSIYLMINFVFFHVSIYLTLKGTYFDIYILYYLLNIYIRKKL